MFEPVSLLMLHKLSGNEFQTDGPTTEKALHNAGVCKGRGGLPRRTLGPSPEESAGTSYTKVYNISRKGGIVDVRCKQILILSQTASSLAGV